MNLPDYLTRQSLGTIRLTGHRIGLEHVVELMDRGCTAEMIATEFDTLTLDHIRQVMAFRDEHRPEVDRYMAWVEEEGRRQEAAHPPSPALLAIRRRLDAERGPNTP